MEKRKANRTRKNRVEVYFDDDEMKIIRKKIQAANVKSQSEYLRTMAVYGKNISMDFPDLKRTFTELSRIGYNINQIAKTANKTGSIFKDDLKEVREAFEQINRKYSEIFMLILRLYERAEKSTFNEILELMDRKET